MANVYERMGATKLKALPLFTVVEVDPKVSGSMAGKSLLHMGHWWVVIYKSTISGWQTSGGSFERREVKNWRVRVVPIEELSCQDQRREGSGVMWVRMRFSYRRKLGEGVTCDGEYIIQGFVCPRPPRYEVEVTNLTGEGQQDHSQCLCEHHARLKRERLLGILYDVDLQGEHRKEVYYDPRWRHRARLEKEKGPEESDPPCA